MDFDGLDATGQSSQLLEKCSAEKALVGAGDRGRTGDIFLGKEALYH